jgi:hypothetical protein
MPIQKILTGHLQFSSLPAVYAGPGEEGLALATWVY